MKCALYCPLLYDKADADMTDDITCLLLQAFVIIKSILMRCQQKVFISIVILYFLPQIFINQINHKEN